MTDLAETILSRDGPCLSSELAKKLVEECSMSSAAARQRVSRLGGSVKRLAYLTFPRNVRFTYLQKDYGSPWFWQALIRALMDSSPAYGNALAALMQRGGVMPKNHFLTACGSPIAQMRHLSPEEILRRFKRASIFEEIDVPGIGTCVVRAQGPEHYEWAIRDMRARIVAEAILLKAIRMWVRNLGLGSYDKVSVRDEGNQPPKVGTFLWDLSAPSYLAPMVEWTDSAKLKPGFIACDVLLGSELTEHGIRPFIQKCTTLRSLKRVGRCLQLFVADRYDASAFRLAKGAGVIPATPATLFGEEVAAGLSQLIDLLKSAAVAAVDPAIFNELFQRLGRIEGAANNLRGALFEFLVAEIVREKYGARITLNKIFKNELGGKAEVDVLGEQGSVAVHFIECKGYHPLATVPDEEVERWLNTRIPLVRSEVLKHPDWKNRKLYFEFWTIGKLSAGAVAKIEKAKSAVRPGKYTLDYRDANRVVNIAKELNDAAILDALQRHFLEHPLATAERDMARETKRNDKHRSKKKEHGHDLSVVLEEL